jgi:branched-chain amino acid transport system ATP-binding protein
LRGVRSGYGTLPVLHGIDLDVRKGETAVILGLNGAGKSTLMHTIAGTIALWEGDIRYAQESISGLTAPQRVSRGICLVPEGRRVFADLTVQRNLELGAWARRDGSAGEALEEVYNLFPRLQERRTQMAGTLSGGEQQMLAIGRGLMSGPRLLCIDEASLGLAPLLVRQLFELVGRIARTGVTLLLVEQNIHALEVADRAFIMQKGSIVYEGTADELRKSDELRHAYLG